MKGMSDLTPEILAKIPKYKEECIKDLYNGVEWKNYNPVHTIEYIEYIYNLSGFEKKPFVLVANDIEEYNLFYHAIFTNNKVKLTNEIKRLFEEKNQSEISYEAQVASMEKLGNEIRNMKKIDVSKNAETQYLILLAEYSRVYLMWYKFIKDEFNLPCSKGAELDWLFEKVKKTSIAKCYFSDELVLVLRLPKEIHRNELGFHNTKGYSIAYENSGIYHINNRKMPAWIFEKYANKTLTFQDFINEKDEDVRGGIIFIVKDNEGNDGLMKFLGAELIDEQQFVHDTGHIETLGLYKTKESYSFLRDANGNTNVPYTFFYEKCPSTGTEYFLDSSAHLKSAEEAAKFHRPKQIPVEIPYNHTEFNN